MNKNIMEILQTATCDALFATAPMEKLSLLDTAEVRSNKCPICKSAYHLERDCGFKVCMNCGSNFKIWSNNAYYIPNATAKQDLSVNEIILNNMGFNRKKDFS